MENAVTEFFEQVLKQRLRRHLPRGFILVNIKHKKYEVGS